MKEVIGLNYCHLYDSIRTESLMEIVEAINEEIEKGNEKTWLASTDGCSVRKWN